MQQHPSSVTGIVNYFSHPEEISFPQQHTRSCFPDDIPRKQDPGYGEGESDRIATHAEADYCGYSRRRENCRENRPITDNETKNQ